MKFFSSILTLHSHSYSANFRILIFFNFRLIKERRFHWGMELNFEKVDFINPYAREWDRKNFLISLSDLLITMQWVFVNSSLYASGCIIIRIIASHKNECKRGTKILIMTLVKRIFVVKLSVPCPIIFNYNLLRGATKRYDYLNLQSFSLCYEKRQKKIIFMANLWRS